MSLSWLRELAYMKREPACVKRRIIVRIRKCDSESIDC